jgi:hypothetical protein
MSGVSVEVSARKVTVPYLCPCCCGVADTALAVSFTRITGERFMRETTRELDFPYCSRCVRHSRWWSAAWRAAAVVLVCGAIAGAGIGVIVGAVVGAGVIVGASVLAAIVGLALRAKARAACCPACIGPGQAVTYHGWVDQVHSFSFASRRYAAAFAEQNERSLVNVTPHVYQLVEQRRVSAPAPRPSLATAHTAPARAMPLWPQRVDRARSLLDNVMRIDRRAIRAGIVKRSGRTS